MTVANTDRLQYLKKLEKTLKQLEWNNFPGIVGLVSKGIYFCFILEIVKESHFKTDLNQQSL